MNPVVIPPQRYAVNYDCNSGMTAILGISALYHDSAAALVVDGEIIAAAQEERFTRRKHDASFPTQAIQYCMQQANLGPGEIDYLVFYEKPFRKFERILETTLQTVPRGYRSFRLAIPKWLRQNLHLRSILKNELGNAFRGKVLFTDHHESHAASAYFASPFDSAAILTVDGVGEWSTTCMGTGNGNRIEITSELRFPHSLGLLYSAFTYYCGFKVNSGEYKLMGLAPYGQPVYADQILDCLIDLKSDGSFRLDQSYFNYVAGLTMTSRKFHGLFGAPPRKPESSLEQRHMDLAASVQQVTEFVLEKMIRKLWEASGCSNLVMAGGVALNCVANGKLLREGPFDHVWIQPASGDAGGALGAALFTWYQLMNHSRIASDGDFQKGSLLGPEYDDNEIEAVLKNNQAVYEKMEDQSRLCEQVCDAIDAGQVVGWFQGRMEFGPRALGSRSILGDARNSEMQSVMNRKIKFRESFRPFAPIVLKEHLHDYFAFGKDGESPYMSFVAQIADSQLIEEDKAENLQGLDRLKQCRSKIPAVTHVDGSARIQTVDEKRFPLLHKLLSTFRKKTGCPVMINTSFNVRGEPIVCTPEDAWQCFKHTNIDILAIGSYIVRKSEQHHLDQNPQNQSHLDQFELD